MFNAGIPYFLTPFELLESDSRAPGRILVQLLCLGQKVKIS